MPEAAGAQHRGLILPPRNARTHANRFIVRRLMQRIRRGETMVFVANTLMFAKERFSLRAIATQMVRPFRWMSARARSMLARMVHGQRLRRDGLMVAVARDGCVYLARPAGSMTPVQVMQANLDVAVNALESAAIGYFLVKTARYRHRIGVRLSDAQRVALALRQSPRAATMYFGRNRPRRTPGLSVARALRDRPLRVFEAYAISGSAHVYAGEYACEIEFWDDAGNALVASADNSVARQIPKRVARASSWTIGGRSYRSLEAFTKAVVPDEITFPIDVVYTWVDGNDPAWQAKKEHTARQHDLARRNAQASNRARYENRDELRYSLRSIAMYAPFVRRVFLVTDDQVPPWLNVKAPRITVVSHRELFGDTGKLPTFNSHAIETRLHRIEGLSEHFMYFNDDVFLGRLARADQFFHASGLTKVFPSRAHIPPGPPRPEDWPADWGAKNARALLEQHLGRTITQKTKHVPMPMRRSVMQEIESRFSEAFHQTACSQFRSPADIAPISSLYLHYAWLAGHAVPGELRYAYLNVGSGRLPWDLRRLLEKPGFDVFCLNDTDSAEDDLADQRAMIEACFEELYPIASEFELPAATANPISD